MLVSRNNTFVVHFIVSVDPDIRLQPLNILAPMKGKLGCFWVVFAPPTRKSCSYAKAVARNGFRF